MLIPPNSVAFLQTDCQPSNHPSNEAGLPQDLLFFTDPVVHPLGLAVGGVAGVVQKLALFLA
jgi:hypothetical protein